MCGLINVFALVNPCMFFVATIKILRKFYLIIVREGSPFMANRVFSHPKKIFNKYKFKRFLSGIDSCGSMPHYWCIT